MNDVLARLTGYELQRSTRRSQPPPPPVVISPKIPTIERIPEPIDAATLDELRRKVKPVDRLVSAPTFILSSVRSGSTLLRLILDTHPQICCPHELHLRQVWATMRGSGRYAMGEVGFDDRALRNLLWDRILNRELARSGKSHYVNKTPNDALIWFEILACWPDARFIFLHRHPAAIVDSWRAATDGTASRDLLAQDVLAYATGMEQARAAHGGLVVRYEDLTADPLVETRRICEFLGVEWDESMVNYGSVEHAGVRRGLGDWSAKLKSGSVQPAAALHGADRIPDALLGVAGAWGYLSSASSADSWSSAHQAVR